jgi:hypothetical protein
MVEATATIPGLTTYSAVPLAGLVAAHTLTFPLYLRTSEHTWVLYQPESTQLNEGHIGRLTSEGISHLFIRDRDREAYLSRVEVAVDRVLLDRSMPIEARADVLFGVATKVADDLLAGLPDRAAVQRAQKVMMATSGFLLRETKGFQSIRRLMTASPGLSRHSLTVSFLSMGLARVVLSADAGMLLVAGLAGLLHDVKYTANILVKKTIKPSVRPKAIAAKSMPGAPTALRSKLIIGMFQPP